MTPQLALRIAGIALLVVAALFVALAIHYFLANDIRSVMDDLSGKARAKGVDRVRRRAAKAREQARAAVVPEVTKGAVTVNPVQPAPASTGGTTGTEAVVPPAEPVISPTDESQGDRSFDSSEPAPGEDDLATLVEAVEDELATQVGPDEDELATMVDVELNTDEPETMVATDETYVAAQSNGAASARVILSEAHSEESKDLPRSNPEGFTITRTILLCDSDAVIAEANS